MACVRPSSAAVSRRVDGGRTWHVPPSAPGGATASSSLHFLQLLHGSRIPASGGLELNSIAADLRQGRGHYRSVTRAAVLGEGDETEKRRIRLDYELRRNRFEIAAEAALLLEALAKARAEKRLDKARQDAAGEVHPATRTDDQGHVAGDGAEKREE